LINVFMYDFFTAKFEKFLGLSAVGISLV